MMACEEQYEKKKKILHLVLAYHVCQNGSESLFTLVITYLVVCLQYLSILQASICP